MAANTLIEMEYSLLIMKFENIFRDTYNAEKFVKYGLKRESQVISVIENQCAGMFDKF